MGNCIAFGMKAEGYSYGSTCRAVPCTAPNNTGNPFDRNELVSGADKLERSQGLQGRLNEYRSTQMSRKVEQPKSCPVFQPICTRRFATRIPRTPAKDALLSVVI